MPAPRISKETVLERITLSFRTHGYHGTSLQDLCEATGLPKASLYNYFSGGKAAMARAALDSVAAWLSERIIVPLSEPGDPRARLASMCTELARFYDKGRMGCLIDLFGIGAEEAGVGEALRDAVAKWHAAIVRPLQDAGFSKREARDRGELAVVRIQGALVLARASGDPKLFMRHLRRLPDDLLAP